jgi:hypothetical protein
MKRYEFVGNQVSLLIGIGMVGFLLAIYMLTGKDGAGEVRYKEIVLVNKDTILKQIYNTRLTGLRDTLRKMQISDVKKKEKVDEIKVAKLALSYTLRDSINFSIGNPDTTIKYFAGIIGVNRDSLYKAIRAEGWKHNNNQIQEIKFTYVDTISVLYQTPAAKTVTLKLKRESHGLLMDFFTVNPLLGFWLVFSIAQMTLWFLVVPMLYGMLKSLQTKVSDSIKGMVIPLNWLISSVLPLAFFVVFAIVFYWYLIDDLVIKDHYFLEGFNKEMFRYSIFGYLAAIACFGMYLMTSMALDELDKTARRQKLSLSTNPVIQSDYEALKKTFEGSFFASAIILSVFVLWAGIAFNGINQTEVMRFYAIYAGKPFLQYDFVFLIGAIHTVILLLFYVPVRLKFNSMQITEDAKAQAASGSGKKIVNSLWESILAILVTSAPLITSVIQKLISSALAN